MAYYHLHSNPILNRIMNQHWNGYLPVKVSSLTPLLIQLCDDLDPKLGFRMEHSIVYLHRQEDSRVNAVHIAKAAAWYYANIKTACGYRDPLQESQKNILYHAINLLIPHAVFEHHMATLWRWPTKDNWRFWVSPPTVASLSTMFYVPQRIMGYFLEHRRH